MLIKFILLPHPPHCDLNIWLSWFWEKLLIELFIIYGPCLNPNSGISLEADQLENPSE